MKCNKIALIGIALINCITSFAQTNSKKDTTDQGWNYSRLISMPTTKVLAPHTMDFYFMHRLGNVGKASNGGFQTLYGFDVASDILIGFDFAVTRNFTVGVSRSKDQELVAVDGKYLLLSQKGYSPVSISIYEEMGVIPQAAATFYATSDPAVPQDIADRFIYLSQLILSRKFSDRLSLEVVPSLSFRNHIFDAINYNNATYDENFIPAIGVGGRFMVSKKMAIVADYYYIISQYRMDNPYQNYYNSLSVGIELKTGGHVFEINFSNNTGLNPTNFLPYQTDTWTKGGFKLGFTISRLFNL